MNKHAIGGHSDCHVLNCINLPEFFFWICLFTQTSRVDWIWLPSNLINKNCQPNQMSKLVFFFFSFFFLFIFFLFWNAKITFIRIHIQFNSIKSNLLFLGTEIKIEIVNCFLFFFSHQLPFWVTILFSYLFGAFESSS